VDRKEAKGRLISAKYVLRLKETVDGYIEKYQAKVVA
jgi:hypothetical protein